MSSTLAVYLAVNWVLLDARDSHCLLLMSRASLLTETCSDFRPRCARLRSLRLAGVTFATIRHHDVTISVIDIVSPSFHSSRHLICAGVGTLVRSDSVRHVAGASIGWR